MLFLWSALLFLLFVFLLVCVINDTNLLYPFRILGIYHYPL
jgi:hypothetical protein